MIFFLRICFWLMLTSFGVVAFLPDKALFILPAQTIRDALTELESRNDLALAHIRSTIPELEKSIISSVGQGYELGFNSFLSPQIFLSYSESAIDFGESLFSPICGPGDYFNNCAVASLLPKKYRDPSQFPSQLKYRYCESNSTDPECASMFQTNAPWVFVRRLVSTAGFVRGACPSFTQAVSWHWAWQKRLKHLLQIETLKPEMPMVDFPPLVNAASKYLLKLSGSAQWPTQVPSAANPMEEFLRRRYLDGGPEFAQAAATCAEQIYDSLQTSTIKSVPTNPDLVARIQSQLGFVEKSVAGLPVKSIWVQTQPLDFRFVARVFRSIPFDEPLPLIKNHVSFQTRKSLVLGFSEWLSEFDPDHEYRLITKDEAMAAGLNSWSCVANKDYLRDGLDDLQITTLNETFSCDFSNLILVRERI